MQTQTTNMEPTPESVWAYLRESNRYLTEKFAETDRQRKESERILTEKFAESDRQRKESERILTEKFAESDRQRKESERILTEKFAETDRLIKANSKDIGGISSSNGCIAEEYFFNSFAKDMRFAGQKFTAITPNLQKEIPERNLKAEYDIVLENNTSIAIIEVKYKAERDDVKPLLKKVETYKLFYPQHANFSFYLGLAGLSVNKSAETEAIKQGIAVIKQVGERMVINDGHLKVF